MRYTGTLIAVLTLSCLPVLAQSTSTGFVYPTPTANPSIFSAAFFGATPADGYFANRWHCGADIRADVGTSVRAVTEGDVDYVSPGGWGDGNVGLIVKHRCSNGRYFLAVYGHVRNYATGHVTAGQQIGTVGPWSYGNHLHFGIYEAEDGNGGWPYINTSQGYGWGMRPMPRPAGSTVDGILTYDRWFDPIGYIRQRSPWGGGPPGPWDGALVQPLDNTETTGWDIEVSGAIWHTGGQPAVSRVKIWVTGGDGIPVHVGDATYGLFYPIAGENIGFSYKYWDARRWADQNVTVHAQATDAAGGVSPPDDRFIHHIHVKKPVIVAPSSVQISPPNPTSGDDLVASATGGSDEDGEAIVGYEYQWSADAGVTWPQSGSTLSNSVTLPGQQWVVRVRTVPNHAWRSEWVTSSPVTVSLPDSRPQVIAWEAPGPTAPRQVHLTFDQAMKQAETQRAFWVRQEGAGGALPGTYSWVGNELQYLLRDPLLPNTTYRIGVTAKALSALGVEMGTGVCFLFTTPERPTVTTFEPPGDSAPGQIHLTFDQPMDAARTQAAFWVHKEGATNALAGRYAWAGNEMQFELTDALLPETTYRVGLTAAAESAGGVRVSGGRCWLFTTGTAPRVVTGAPQGMGVGTDAVVRVTFDRAMCQTVTQRAFWLRKEGTSVVVSGAFSWEGNDMVFTPASPLAAATTYRVGVTAPARSAGGIAMGRGYCCLFTTGGAPAPVAVVTATAAPTAQGGAVTVSLSSSADLIVTIRNVAGRPIALLTPGMLDAGTHALLWNGRSRLGTKVPAGTYLVEVCAYAPDGGKCSALVPLRLRR